MGKRRKSSPKRDESSAGAGRSTKSASIRTDASARAGRRRRLVVAGLVALLAFAFYGRTIGYELTRSDDRLMIVEDAHFITDPSNVFAAFDRPFLPRAGRGHHYYRPLATLSLMVDAHFSGTEPSAYHATNVVLHALVCGLLVLFLARLGLALRLGAAGAAIFAVHPALTEAVAWIPGRIDVMLAIFSLLAFLALARWLERPRLPWLVAHGLAILAALLTKEAAVVLPLAFAAFLLFEEGRRGALRRGVLWAAWGVPLAVWAALWLRVSGGELAGATDDGPSGILVNLPAVLMQLGKTVFPFQLAVLADTKSTSWIPGPAVLLLLAAAVWWLRGRPRRMALWSALVCLALLAPNVLVSDYLILENRLYVPVLAVIVVALFAGADLLARFPARRTATALAAVAAVVFVVYAGLSWRYTAAFRNSDVFTAQAVETSPDLALAHLQRGVVTQTAGDPASAEKEYRRAIELDDSQVVVNNNLGVILMNRGDLAGAEAHLRREIAINPDYAKSYYNLSVVLSRTGREQEAERSMLKAIEVDPVLPDAYAWLAVYYARHQRWNEAEAYRKRAEALGMKLDSPGN